MADQKSSSQVRLENKTAHVLHITLAGGEIISVPPHEEGGSQNVTFNDADERARFEAALGTDTVRKWIDDKDLVVHGAGAAPAAPQGTSGGEPGAPSSGSGDQPGTSTTPASPSSKRGGRGGE